MRRSRALFESAFLDWRDRVTLRFSIAPPLVPEDAEALDKRLHTEERLLRETPAFLASYGLTMASETGDADDS